LFRRLSSFLTPPSALLLLCVLALWSRSGPAHHTSFLLRTSPAYATGPRLKWLLLDTRDGLHLTAFVKVNPLMPRPSGPPWRQDVRVGSTAASVESPGRAVPVHWLLTPVAAWRPSARELTDAERGDYDSAIESDYAATARVCHDSSGTTMSGGQPSGPPWLQRLGVCAYGRDNDLLGDERLPGAYHYATVRLPFALPAVAAAVLPLAAVRRCLGWWRTRRRLRARLCPTCAYDLRSSPSRCPECGRPVVQAETDAAYQSIPRLVLTRPRRGPRGTLVRRGVTAACLVAAALAVRHSAGKIPSAEWRHLRRQLQSQLATVERRADRLRAEGHTASAAQLDEALRAARRVAAGGAPEPRAGPALDVVSLRYFGYPGSVVWPPGERIATVEVTATDRPIVLALCASEPLTWRLKLARGVRLDKVLLEGGRAQHVLGLPPGVPVEDHTEQHGNWYEYLTPLGDEDPNEQWRNEALLRERTGLRVRTWQARDRYEGRPFVVGPHDPIWSLRHALHALRPAHLAAAREERDAAAAAVRSIRFTAPYLHVDPPADAPSIRRPALWSGWGDYMPARRTYWCVARYDVHGPIESTIRRVPDAEGPPVFGRPLPPAQLPRDNELDLFDPARGRFVRVALPCDRVPRVLRTNPVAMDPRRGRLWVADWETGRLHTCDLATGALEGRQTLGDRPGRRAIAYSPHDDCFYAVGPAPGGRGHVMAVTRLGPDGTPQWMIPLQESIGDPSFAGEAYVAGKYLVLLTPPTRDLLDPDGPPHPRCVVLDPATNTVVYSGPIAPHAGDGGSK
jgi:hypothetical protein